MELLDLPDNPVPPDTVVAEVVTEDGVTLRAARWPAVKRPVLGTVCIFQGRGEQIEKYFRVVQRLRERGFAVATFDWRGQGGSARLLRSARKGHVGAFSDYGRDIAAVRKQLVLPDCPPPFFGLGHSMGGHILLASAERLSPWLSRLVLTAPFLDFGRVPMGRRGIRRVAGLMVRLGLGRCFPPGSGARILDVRTFEGNPLTSDPETHRMMMDVTALRPDLSIDAPTVRWLYEAACSMDRLDREDFPERVRLPVMLVNCGADLVVSPRAVERMARRLRQAAYIFVPGARHEIMMEADLYAAQFWAAFDAFVPGSPA